MWEQEWILEDSEEELRCPEPTTNQFGYGTKTHLARWVDKEVSTHLFGEDRYTHWIASEFNPAQNPDGSNPLAIFRELDLASKNPSKPNDKVESVRAQLLSWLYHHLGRQHRDIEAQLKREIALATYEFFKPEVWRVPRKSWDKFSDVTDVGVDAMYTEGYVLIFGEDFEVVVP